MSNHRRHQRRFNARPASLVRRAPPKVVSKGGHLDSILCPFCEPPHQVYVGVPAACGTELELTAVQATYRNMACELCHKTEGTLVRVHGHYVHAMPCTPGKRLYTETPKRSRTAALAWKLPARIQSWNARRTRRAPVQLFGEKGEPRGFGWQDVTFEVGLDTINRLRMSHGPKPDGRRLGSGPLTLQDPRAMDLIRAAAEEDKRPGTFDA